MSTETIRHYQSPDGRATLTFSREARTLDWPTDTVIDYGHSSATIRNGEAHDMPDVEFPKWRNKRKSWSRSVGLPRRDRRKAKAARAARRLNRRRRR